MLSNFTAVVSAALRICYSLQHSTLRDTGMKNTIWNALPVGALLLVLLALGACGQKGDLYLPEEELSEEAEQ